jgi:hypothetical protein
MNYYAKLKELRDKVTSDWRFHYTDGSDGTVDPGDDDKWEYDGIASPDYYDEYMPDVYTWPEGGPVKPTDKEQLILHMRNSLDLWLELFENSENALQSINNLLPKRCSEHMAPLLVNLRRTLAKLRGG